MKQYTGTKTVKAVPMTYGETHERGLIRENAGALCRDTGLLPSSSSTYRASL